MPTLLSDDGWTTKEMAKPVSAASPQASLSTGDMGAAQGTTERRQFPSFSEQATSSAVNIDSNDLLMGQNLSVFEASYIDACKSIFDKNRPTVSKPNQENYFKPKDTKVIRGGFGSLPPVPQDAPSLYPVGNCYPPPSNSAYNRNLYISFGSMKHKVVHTASTITKSWDGTSATERDSDTAEDEEKQERLLVEGKRAMDTLMQIIEHREKRPEEEKTTAIQPTQSTERPEPTRGEKLAEEINFKRPAWESTPPGASGAILDGEEQRRDFIKAVDVGAHLEYCNKCKKFHIPPGGGLTLEDRDTCYSDIPEWFPKERVEHAWEALTAMLNEYVVLEEISQGYGHKPSNHASGWDKEFHNKDKKWAALGRPGGGWWKCKSGPDAPAAERSCDICHRTKTSDELAHAAAAAQSAKKAANVSQRKQVLLEWIESRIKEVGKKDRQIVEDSIRKFGYPEHFGPMPEQPCWMHTYRTKFQVMRGASDVSIETIHSVDSDSTAITTPSSTSPVTPTFHNTP